MSERRQTMTVNKKEFADRMAENGGITKKAARKAVKLFIETIEDFLSEGEKIMISGFGRFEVRTMKEKVGNLKGKSCIIPEHEYVGFHASNLLMDRIQEIKKIKSEDANDEGWNEE